MSNVAIAAPDPTKARDFSRFSCRRFDTVGTVRLAVPGELDMATVPELEGTLRHARADAWRVVLDLRELEFIDSSGVHLGAVSAVRADAVASVRTPGRHPVLRRATRDELSHDISLRSAGRVWRPCWQRLCFPPGDPPPPPLPPRRRVTQFHGANRHQNNLQ
jgi:anti-anti-sigma factor